MQQYLNISILDCKPWQSSLQNNNFNLLNRLNSNLKTYQLDYRKVAAQSKPKILPSLREHTQKSKQLSREEPLRHNTEELINHCRSDRRVKKVLPPIRDTQTALQTINKENKPRPPTQTLNSRRNYPNKVYFMNFQQQVKQSRLPKKEMHKLIFGQKIRYRKIQEMDCFR